MNINKIIHNWQEKNKLSLNKDIKKIFILTGAGISAESGISTFRDKHGLWGKHSIYEVARPEAMELTPEIFYNFQNMRAKSYKDKVPNIAHLYLKKLEEKFEVYIVTQNIDDLHEKAGSTTIKHIHGKLHECICNTCHHKFEYFNDIFGSDCKNCHVGKVRPDVVLFKEQPKYMKEIFSLIYKSDLFIQIGTSGKVYPAANLIKEFNEMENKASINISLEPTDNNKEFKYSFYGNASKWVPYIVNQLLEK